MAATANAPRYWGKESEEYNYLFILTKTNTLLIKWVQMINGIKVYSVSQLKGKPKRFKKDYLRVDTDIAAEVLLAAMHTLQTSMPYR